MVTFVLDASAVIRFLDDEAGADRVDQIFAGIRKGTCLAVISAVNWGEVVGKISQRRGSKTAEELTKRISSLGLVVVPVNAKRAEQAALTKVQYKIPYADCVGVELAGDSPDHILITADFDVKPAEHYVRIEFLPKKLAP